jgi:hypothetical protein
MENSPQIRHIVAGVAAAIVIIGAIVWSLYPAPVAAPGAEGSASSTPASTAATTTKDGVTASGNFTVTKDDTITLPTPPDFRAPIAFAADVAPDVRAAITTRAQALEAKLAKDSFDLGSWIDLGAMRKMAGDYRGAETAWLFVTKTAPRNTIAFSNLADLYMNFLKDYPQAETMYKKVIALDPAQIEPYVSLATLYGNLYKTGTSAAEDILKKGIAAHPDSADLHVLLARMYAKAGRAAEAKVQYQAAISAAQKQGSTDLAAQLKTEAGL